MAVGGIREAVVRSMLYVGMARGAVDERGFEMVRRIRSTEHGMPRLSLPAFKALIREQFLMLLVDPDASLAAIPSMLPAEPQARDKALGVLRQVLSVRGTIDGEMGERMKRIELLFGTEKERVGTLRSIARATGKDDEGRKAS
jgi:hypothetical protein